MKPNLLEQLIKKALLEQDEKKVIIGPMSKSGRNDVIAAGGITGFTVTMKYRGQAPTMESIIDRLQDQVAANSQIGRGSGYDVRDKSDDATSRYMYVIGDDIAKSKRILKMNVWVLLYSPLMQLAQQIDSLKNNDRYYEQMTGVIQWYAGGIPVYTYNDAAKWISILKNQSSNLKLDLTDNQLKKKIAFPNLTTINKQELDQEKISGETKIVTIDNTNRKEYGNIRFTGTAEMSYDAYGSRDITYINGSTPVTRIEDGKPGIYTGDFKNGMPSNGKTVWDDGEVWEGEMSSSVVKDPDTGLPIDYNFEKSDNTKVSNSKEVIKTQVANTSSDSETAVETNVITYPYKWDTNNGELMIYTTSPSDDYIYYVQSNAWYTAKKLNFESALKDGSNVVGTIITKPTVIALLNKTFSQNVADNTTPDQSVDTKNTKDNKPLVQREKPETIKTDKNKTTVEFLNKEKSKNRNGIAFIKVSDTPIYNYKNKQWVKAGIYKEDSQYISYLGNSTDYKYIRVKFVKDNKTYWIPTTSVK